MGWKTKLFLGLLFAALVVAIVLSVWFLVMKPSQDKDANATAESSVKEVDAKSDPSKPQTPSKDPEKGPVKLKYPAAKKYCFSWVQRGKSGDVRTGDCRVVKGHANDSQVFFYAWDEKVPGSVPITIVKASKGGWDTNYLVLGQDVSSVNPGSRVIYGFLEKPTDIPVKSYQTFTKINGPKDSSSYMYEITPAAPTKGSFYDLNTVVKSVWFPVKMSN